MDTVLNCSRLHTIIYSNMISRRNAANISTFMLHGGKASDGTLMKANERISSYCTGRKLGNPHFKILYKNISNETLKLL